MQLGAARSGVSAAVTMASCALAMASALASSVWPLRVRNRAWVRRSAGFWRRSSRPRVLEVVDQRHHAAGRDAQGGAERLLRLALGGRDVAEHGELAGLDAEGASAR